MNLVYMKKTDDIDLYIREKIDLVKTMDRIEKSLNYYASRFDKLEAAILNKPYDLSVGDVALAEGKSEKTILRYIKNGFLNATKPVGSKSYQISREDYNNYKLGLKQSKHSA